VLQQTAAWTDNEGTGARRGSLPPPPLQATRIDCRFSEFPCQLRRPPSLLIPAKDFLQKLTKPFSLAPFLSSYAYKCARCSEREGDCRIPCVLHHGLLSLFSKRRKRSTGRNFSCLTHVFCCLLMLSLRFSSLSSTCTTEVKVSNF
jgi:hypothetical protein